MKEVFFFFFQILIEILTQNNYKIFNPFIERVKFGH